jgi:hypothetical protein
MTPTTPHLLEALDAAFYGLTGRWAATLARGEAIGAVIKVPANGRKPVGYAVSWRNFDHESDAQFRLDAVRRNAIAFVVNDWAKPLEAIRDKAEALDNSIEMSLAMNADASAKIAELTETNEKLWSLLARALACLNAAHRRFDAIEAAALPAPPETDHDAHSA